MIRSHHGRTPLVAVSAYIDPQAVVIGDVSIGEFSSVWPCVVIRGDVNWIRIGSGWLNPARVQGHASVAACRHGYGRARRHPARLHD